MEAFETAFQAAGQSALEGLAAIAKDRRLLRLPLCIVMSSAVAPLSAGQGASGRTLLGGRLPQDPGGLCCLSGDAGRARATLTQASNDKSKNVKDAAVATSKASHGFPFLLSVTSAACYTAGFLTSQVIMEMVSPFAVELLLPSFLSGLAVKASRSLNFCKMLE